MYVQQIFLIYMMTQFAKTLLLYSNYTPDTKKRGYIVFAFSVIMFVCLFVCKLFSVKDFSATTWVRVLKFGKKLDSDELFWVAKKKKTATYCLSVPLFVHFSLSPMEISVT